MSRWRWSEDTTVRFVSEYLKYECLWNRGSPLYRNKQARQAAYDGLEKHMGITGFIPTEIQMKIRNIRSTYSQELKKIRNSKQSGSGADTVYVPSIKWFKSLNEALNNINSKMQETPSNLDSPSSDPLENNSFENDEDSITQESIVNTENSKPEFIVIPENSQEQTIFPHQNRHKRQKLAQLQSVVNQLKGIVKTVDAPPSEENEFEVFGKNIGLQLKAMPLQTALEAQMHIQTYISKMRLRQLTSGQNVHLPQSRTHSRCSDCRSSTMSSDECNSPPS